MNRPTRKYCEPYLEYIRRLEAYVDYLESNAEEKSGGIDLMYRYDRDAPTNLPEQNFIVQEKS
jgi:hypothetical protein